MSEPTSSYIKFIGYFISFFCYAIFLLYNWCYVKKTNIERNIIQIWLDKSNELHISTAADVENQRSPLNDQGYLLDPSTAIVPHHSNPEEPTTNNLPQGWSARLNPMGKLYYQNDITKKTQWQKPDIPHDQTLPNNNDDQYIKFEFEIKNAMLRSNFAVARIIGDLINSTVIIIYFHYFTGLHLTSMLGTIQLVIYCISMVFDLIDIIIHLIPKTKRKVMENYVLSDSFNAKYYCIQFIHAYFSFFALFFTIYLCHKTLSEFDTYWIITLSFTNKIKSILEIHWKSFRKLVFNYSLTHKPTKCDKVIYWLINKLIYILSELLLYIPLFLISSSIIACFVATDNNNIYFNGLLPSWFIVCVFYSIRKLLLYYDCDACINNYTCRKCNICFGFLLISTLLACIQLGFILYCVEGKTYYYSYTSLFLFVLLSLISIIFCINIPNACTVIINHLGCMCMLFCAAVSTAYGVPQQVQFDNDPNAEQIPMIVKIFQFLLLLLTYFVLMPFIVMFGILIKDIFQLFFPLVTIISVAGCYGVCLFFVGLCTCDNDQLKGIGRVLVGVILIVFAFWFVWEFEILSYIV